jgi:hypothetical protein
MFLRFFLKPRATGLPSDPRFRRDIGLPPAPVGPWEQARRLILNATL